MRAAVYYSNNDVRIEERPVPKIGEYEALLRVEASGICGSDVMEWYRRDKVPLVLGHEVAGRIVEVGKAVKNIKAGDRVAAAHHVPCGKCRYCRRGHPTVCDTLRTTNFDPGGFSEYIRLPAINVKYGIFPVPKEVSYEEATFAEPLACVLRGQRLSGVTKGADVLVIGSGISGILHIQMARLNKAGNVIAADIADFKLKKAKGFGADGVIDASREDVPQKVREFTGGKLADFVILCAGTENALVSALKSVDRGGTVLIFSAMNEGLRIQVPVNEIFWRSEVKILSSYAASPAEHIEALKLIKEKKINARDMITHRFSLTETGKGFKLVADGRQSIKVIINPGLTDSKYRL